MSQLLQAFKVKIKVRRLAVVTLCNPAGNHECAWNDNAKCLKLFAMFIPALSSAWSAMQMLQIWFDWYNQTGFGDHVTCHTTNAIINYKTTVHTRRKNENEWKADTAELMIVLLFWSSPSVTEFKSSFTYICLIDSEKERRHIAVHETHPLQTMTGRSPLL